jgi:hypothetical protein
MIGLPKMQAAVFVNLRGNGTSLADTPRRDVSGQRRVQSAGKKGISATLLETMAGTTRLELATSAVTVQQVDVTN